MNFKQFCEKYNIRLNRQQSEAVQTVEGPILLLAVPGSGKTTVLVARLGYMIYCLDIKPESVLTMTYTVAATNDMRERFCSVFGDELRGRLEFRTINGVCANIIRSYERLGGGSAFELLSDEKEIAAVISAIYRDTTGNFPTESDIKGVRTLITYAKNMQLDEAEIKRLDEQSERFSEMYARYCGELRKRRCMDYDDQMVYALRILERYPELLERIRRQYKYVCVDEAQDTSKIQHRIIALIAGGNDNLFMVGDEDQSIYGFRAAYPEALMSFEKEHSGAKILLMEENFRSNALIVTAADKFISKNINRHKKQMCASRAEGEPIAEVTLPSKKTQYAKIIEMAEKSGRETAVLYRDNESALPLVDLLERKGIPYRIRSTDMTFFSHRIIQDITNIIRFALDPYDTEAFLQIYYKIGTYINKNSAVIACEMCRKRHITVWEALFSLSGMTAGSLKGSKSVKLQMEKLEHEYADKAIYRIFNHMGYRDYLERMNMRESKVAVLQAIGANESSPQGLLRRLNELSEIMRNGGTVRGGNIVLSTVHSAKGLEYDTVYLMDVCDGIFPEKVIADIARADKDELRIFEEERRLFYVAATRAKNRLVLFTYADATSAFCRDFLNKPSVSYSKESKAVILQRKPMEDMSGFEEFSKKYSVGSRLDHRLFGEGTVQSREDDVVTVSFKNGQLKKLSLTAMFLQKLTRE